MLQLYAVYTHVDVEAAIFAQVNYAPCLAVLCNSCTLVHSSVKKKISLCVWYLISNWFMKD